MGDHQGDDNNLPLLKALWEPNYVCTYVYPTAHNFLTGDDLEPLYALSNIFVYLQKKVPFSGTYYVY